MKITNRKVRYNYQILDKIEAGIRLTGPEVKSIKEGQINLKDAYVKIDNNNEVWLINANIAPYKFSHQNDYQPTKKRKLLLHKNQIISFKNKQQTKNLVIIPLSCYTKSGKIKVKIALAKPKKAWQKKEKIKRRDIDRETRKLLKNRG